MAYQIGEERSITSLMTDLAREVTELTRKEVELAKVEISDKVGQVEEGVSSLAIGGLVLFSGILLLLAALSLWLGDVTGWNETSPWLAPLIVGVIVGGIGIVVLQTGRTKLKTRSLTPSRTMESLRRNRDVIRERTT